METIYLLKDLSHVTGLSVYTIKYYLKLGLVSEFGRSPATNFRYFNNETLNRLNEIRMYREQGKSLKEIKRILNSASPVTHV
ncbi:MAG: MerR family transcriptional regulator [Candidatus Auribacterota bacterium]|jgi:DNA-binding transcriptional MerR regulator|uniref:MerR family transcriptional regulator n=1 Tax=Candidatus Auribacter fodinae TaxID=2093366 RepID=A0A3A4RD32_9BACT|nr:MAG: MerR family transcriptional regulator [Candidatus Auribacter fodinae]